MAAKSTYAISVTFCCKRLSVAKTRIFSGLFHVTYARYESLTRREIKTSGLKHYRSLLEIKSGRYRTTFLMRLVMNLFYFFYYLVVRLSYLNAYYLNILFYVK